MRIMMEKRNAVSMLCRNAGRIKADVCSKNDHMRFK